MAGAAGTLLVGAEPKVGRRPKNDQDAFPRWIAQIDREIRARTGLGRMDFPTYEYVYHYKLGKTAYQAASEIICRARGNGR